MKTKSTDKEILVKGLKQMGISLILMFTGPTLLHVILSNRDRSFYIPLLIIALVICALAIIFAFKGLNTILNSLFNSKKSR
ncbi:DUF6095 family protein [Olleya sp. YS]|uniref:DUF6095 family protein n=1 Tax=Olleya sp. YS TaxID=3028318 RepID=UPI0024340C37|nr:DUF6095 family protein [Olleya sp. YS]WGD34122.1 DUF6095 family protein [Olleya sp. YS]